MAGLQILQLIGALLLVIAVLLVSAAALKLVSIYLPRLQSRLGLPHETPRLSLRATLALGPKARLWLVQCDDQEHLLLIGPEGMLVLDMNRRPPVADQL